MNKPLTTGIVLAPSGDKLGEVVRAKDGGVSGQVVEAVRDDGHHDVQHDEGAEEDEGDKVQVGHVGPAVLVRVNQFTWNKEQSQL